MLPKRRQPTHPGVILQIEFLNPLGLTSRRFAELLGGQWNEYKVEAIIQGTENIPDHAAQEFANVFGTSAQFWHNLKNNYNSWHANQIHNKKGSLKPWKKAQ